MRNSTSIDKKWPFFCEKTESTDTLWPFLTNEKDFSESARQLRFCRVLIHDCRTIIRDVKLTFVKGKRVASLQEKIELKEM
jgi:hypothetical protein